MDGFGGAFAAVRGVEVDVYTAAFRISGTVQTRFGRVAEILNLLSSTHLGIERATVTEHADPERALAASSAVVALDEILVMAAPGLSGEPRGEMRIPKRPVSAHLAIPPLRLTGSIYVPMGSRPVDGLLNVAERFLPMTDVTLTSAAYPELGRSAAVLAVRRDRAHVMLVADDERPDELLAEVLDQRTAESWLRAGDEVG